MHGLSLRQAYMTGRINQIVRTAVSVLLVVLLPVSGLPRRARGGVCWCVCIGTSCAGCLRCLRGNCVSCRGLSCAALSFGCCSVVLQQWRGCASGAQPRRACCLRALDQLLFCMRLHIYVLQALAPLLQGCKVPGDARPCARGRVDVVLWSKWGWEGLFVDFLLIIGYNGELSSFG